MIRGTTPTHTFEIPFDTALIADLRISYAQTDGEIVVKCKDDATLTGNTISVTLTQEDTLNFNCSKKVLVQIKIKTHKGDVMGSDVMCISVERCLNEEVL